MPTISDDVAESFSYQGLKVILPFAVVASAVASATVFFVYVDDSRVVAVPILLLSLLLWLIKRTVLPKIRTASQLDVVCFFVYGCCISCVSVGQIYAQGSPVSCALLTLFAATAFSRNWIYVAFVAFSLSQFCLCVWISSVCLPPEFWHLILIAPAFCAFGRITFERLTKSVQSSQDGLRNTIARLETEQQRRRESERQLVHAQKMEGLGLVAAGVAHDFNNHLQSISMLSELIQNGAEPEHSAERIRDVAAQASGICSRMLAYAGKTPEHREPVELRPFFDRCRKVIEPSLPDNVSVTWNDELSEPHLGIYVNPSEIQECLFNLVRNAVEASAARPGIVGVRLLRLTQNLSEELDWHEFGTLDATNEIAFEVSDNGIGMNAETLERCVDPYFTTKEDGHGFGLATTLGIARTYGGGIRIHTRLGMGTTIQLVLPLSDSAGKSESVDEPEVFSSLPQNILLIDDDSSVRMATEQLLKTLGCNVEAACSGEEALQKADDAIDLFVVDYSMPGMKGTEFLNIVRSRGIDCPAVLCTGYAATNIELEVAQTLSCCTSLSDLRTFEKR